MGWWENDLAIEGTVRGKKTSGDNTNQCTFNRSLRRWDVVGLRDEITPEQKEMEGCIKQLISKEEKLWRGCGQLCKDIGFHIFIQPNINILILNSNKILNSISIWTVCRTYGLYCCFYYMLTLL